VVLFVDNGFPSMGGAKGLISPSRLRAAVSRDLAERLSFHEKKVLLALKDRKGGTPEEIRKAGGFRQAVEVANAASWLQSKGLVRITDRVVRSYRLARKVWAKRPLPERRALRALADAGGTLPLDDLRRGSRLRGKDFEIALGWLRRKDWATIKRTPAGPVAILTDAGRAAVDAPGPDERLLAALAAEGELGEESVDPQVVADLRSRQDILAVRERRRQEIRLTPKGEEVLALGIELKEEVAQVTPELLRTGRWKDVSFRKYDVRAFAPTIHPGKRHPVSQYIEKVRRIFLSMGFTEIEGAFVQPAFWPFDALFQPQDHPARDLLDTYYVDAPDLPLPEEDTVRRVAEMHETGGGISEGWRYAWRREEATRPVLRPHTTALTIRHLADHPDPPVKAFVVGKNFRRDAVDATHLWEFYQIEGVVMEEGANLAMLIGLMKEFYGRMGFPEIRVRPGYFPYTEPSMEPEAYLGDGRWLELGGSGIFRPEVTQPFGITHPVLAWGLGLERLVMAVEGLADIRDLYLSDLEWLRDHPVVR
jgi:phenylalanyl-tRNA synthetase alpha chain